MLLQFKISTLCGSKEFTVQLFDTPYRVYLQDRSQSKQPTSDIETTILHIAITILFGILLLMMLHKVREDMKVVRKTLQSTNYNMNNLPCNHDSDSDANEEQNETQQQE